MAIEKGTPNPPTPVAPPRVGTYRLLLALLILVSASTRIAYLIYRQAYLEPAGGEVLRAARSLARNGTIERLYSDESGASAHVAPLYPLLLAGLFRIFGTGAAGVLAGSICGAFAATAAIALLPAVARAAGLSVRAGWAAAFALALLPTNFWVETSGLWEQPFAALALLALLLAFCRASAVAWKGVRPPLAVGLLLGLIALLSPALLPAGILMLAAEFVSRRGERGRVAVAALVMTAVAGLVVAPWAIRNRYALGGYVLLRSNFGLELAVGHHDKANGTTYVTGWDDPASPFREIHPYDSAAERTRLMSVGELAYMREKRDTALRWIAAHPARTLELTLIRLRLFWFPDWDTFASGPIAPFRVGIAWLLNAGALANLAYSIFTGRRHAWLLAASLIGPSLVYVVTHVDERYRYPTYALSALLAFDLLFAALGAVGRGRPSLPAPAPSTGVGP